jgi:hypothetical protein
MRGASLGTWAPVVTCAGGAGLDLITAMLAGASRRYPVCCVVVDGSTTHECQAQASRPSGAEVVRGRAYLGYSIL